MKGCDIDLFILESIIRGPGYGYPLRESIMKRTNNLVDITRTYIYLRLSKFVENGLLKVVTGTKNSEGPPRKFYKLTNAGARMYNQRKMIYDRLVSP